MSEVIKMSYSKTNEASSKLNESNDCMVKAISISMNIPYEEVHEELRIAGRKSRRGTFMNTADTAMDILCRRYNKQYVQSSPRNLYSRLKGGPIIKGKISLKRISKVFPKGNFILFTGSHASAMIDGHIDDWAEGRKKQVYRIWEIEERESNRAILKIYAAHSFTNKDFK